MIHGKFTDEMRGELTSPYFWTGIEMDHHSDLCIGKTCDVLTKNYVYTSRRRNPFGFFRVRSGPPAQSAVEGVLEDIQQTQTLVEPPQHGAGALPLQPRKRASSNRDLHSSLWRMMAHHSAPTY